MDDAEPQSTEANARLIAAAPEMLELLKEANCAICLYGDIYDDEVRELTGRIDTFLSRVEGDDSE